MRVKTDKKKIIIAEDNRDLCELLKDILEEEGYIVEVVHDGFSLISFLKEKQDIDAVVLDLIMPEKGGISIFETVRSVSPASKLVIYTGYSDYSHSVFAKEADAFISKTEGSEKLIQTLKKVLS